MKMAEYYSEYCTACGLCSAYKDVKFSDENGFDVPDIRNEEQISFCQKICPVNAHSFNEKTHITLWGESKGIFLAYSLNEDVRFKAASGGVITSLAIYLLESHKADFVLQIGKDTDPLKLKLYCNAQAEDVVECVASRYITGISYEKLPEYLIHGKTYAIIGKPCDIEAITNLMKIEPTVKERIKYRLTFFCAGAPSRKASERLIESLGANLESVSDIRYRGNGWPGLAVVKTEKKVFSMPYIESWNNILGRDIRKICKFCINGIGEVADVSCGDLWKLNEERKPIFFENAGQNIVFARSEKGLELLNEALKAGYIYAEKYTNIGELGYIQPNHIMKRTTMLGKMIGLKILHQNTPGYNYKHLKNLSKNVSFLQYIKTVLGTVKRGIKGTL